MADDVSPFAAELARRQATGASAASAPQPDASPFAAELARRAATGQAHTFTVGSGGELISNGDQSKTGAPTLFPGFQMGAGDPPVAAAQIAAHAAAPVVPSLAPETDSWVRQREADYQANRGEPPAPAARIQVDPVTGRASWVPGGPASAPIDGGRMLGNLFATAPLGAVGPAAGASLLARTAAMAGTGAVASALRPETGNDQSNFWTAKAKEAGEGAATGAVMGPATKLTEGAVMPTFAAPQQKLLDEGVPLTLGQMAGGKVKRFEDAASSYSLGIIPGAQQRGVEGMNRAAANRALEPIGQTLPDSVNTGHDTVQYVRQTLYDAYDKTLPLMKAQLDDGLHADLESALTKGAGLPDAQRAQLDQIVNKDIAERIAANPSGLKDIQSDLRQTYEDLLRGNPGPYELKLSRIVSDLQDGVSAMAKRANPELADQLDKIDQGYSNFKIVQQAAASTNSPGGVANPTQLHAAVKAQDTTKDNRAFSEGDAQMQDLSGAAKMVLPSSVPNSGTVDRAMVGSLLAGGLSGVVHPAIAGAALATLPYSGLGMKFLNWWATAAPEARAAIRDAVSQVSPYTAPAAASGISSIFNPPQTH